MSHRRTDTPANDDLARVELLHEDERVRRAAIRKVFTPAGRWSLRTALRLDPSARVRAEAAEHMARLGAPQADELAQLRTSTRESLCDALDDERPLVRHEALRALARLGEIDAYDAVERVATTDTLWWIRRTAVIAMSALGGIGARGDLEGVELRTERLVHALRARLDDPAWRVRHAVVQELEPLALESDAWREKVLAPLANAPVQASTALAYLAAQLSGVGEVPRTLAEPPEVAHPLQDPDPAVVAARLARLGPGEIAPRTLVPWLADPHVTLRSQAIRRLADSGDEDAIRHAFHWLDEPRIPYVHDAIRELLDLAPWARALLPDEAPAPGAPPVANGNGACS